VDAERPEAVDPRLPTAAGLVLGFGLGMFIDGIVLHQLLQWHHMVSEFESTNDVAGLEANTTWDGVFHASAWVVTAVGALLLWRSRRTDAGPWTLRPFVGLLLIGWGAFHAVDQIVFHLIVGAHHIRQVDDYQVYDWSFFAAGVLFAVTGWLLLGERRRAAPS
jgi:uncharacterized membrane protein